MDAFLNNSSFLLSILFWYVFVTINLNSFSELLYASIPICFSLVGCSISNDSTSTPETKNHTYQSDLDIIKKTDYSDLTKSQMLTIIRWIENRYEYYASIEGKYSGDKYTQTIFNEAADRYNKTSAEISKIWDKSYELKYGK